MSRTKRELPNNRWNRSPKHRHKMLAGESSKRIVTDWDDMPIAARKEVWQGDKWWRVW